jgi:hypothetical protein
MSSAFLFGAGASFGSGSCYPEPPPLGNGLNGLFKKLQERGGFAASVTNPLADLFIDNFEAGMAELHSTSTRDTFALLREMSLYFSEFEPLEGNHYKELIKFAISLKHPVVLATTNYDLLIEYSICQLGYRVLHELLPVWTNTHLVLKIHGSCNFLPNIPNITFRNVSTNATTVIDAGVKVVQVSEVAEFCNKEDSIAPAIAMYAKGKAVKFCPKFILQQQKLWQESVLKVKRIFVIGLRVNPEDAHIWENLASSKAQLLYVGFEKEDFENWTKKNGRRNAYWIANKFDESIPIIKDYLKQ